MNNSILVNYDVAGVNLGGVYTCYNWLCKS